MAAKGKGSASTVPSSNGANADPHKAAKAATLAKLMSDINDKFGKGSLMVMGDVEQNIDTTPTGSLTLDRALGGGLPKGRIIEVYGTESSGKTTLAIHAMAEVQRLGGTVAFIDAEHAFNPGYAQRCGLDVASVWICQPDYGEMGLEVADQLIRSNAMDMVVVDSVAALIPRAEIEGEVGQQTIGLQARLMSAAMRRLATNTYKANCTLIFINQMRQKVGVIFGSPDITSGGLSLKYYASARIEMRKKGSVKPPKSESEIGIQVRAKVVKNKVGPPFRVAEFDIMFDSGISREGGLLDVGERVGPVQKNGAYYYYGDLKLGQGRDNAIAFLKAKENRDIAIKLEVEVRQAMESMGAKAAGQAFDSVDEEGGKEEGGESAVGNEELTAEEIAELEAVEEYSMDLGPLAEEGDQKPGGLTP